MRHCQIQCNFGGIDDLCKLGKEYLIALTRKLCPISRQNSQTFDISHTFLTSVVAKLLDVKNSPVFWPHPVCNSLHEHSKSNVITSLNFSN